MNMYAIEHRLVVPYDPQTVLAQFFDFEHVAHVHPNTLGKVALRTLGHHSATADLFWPLLLGIRVRSGFRQEFHPPDRVTAEVIDGWGKGTRYEAMLSLVPEGTAIWERLEIPGLAGWVASRVRRQITYRIIRVWEEDLRLGMCRGGWPGLDAIGVQPSEIAASS